MYPDSDIQVCTRLENTRLVQNLQIIAGSQYYYTYIYCYVPRCTSIFCFKCMLVLTWCCLLKNVCNCMSHSTNFVLTCIIRPKLEVVLSSHTPAQYIEYKWAHTGLYWYVLKPGGQFQMTGHGNLGARWGLGNEQWLSQQLTFDSPNLKFTTWPAVYTMIV